jgi:hypothetical protein
MAVAEYVEAHYDTLNLQSDVIKYPESAELESLSLKTTRNVRINQYFVEFDAIFEATIVVEGTVKREPESDYATEWFRVSCKAKIQNTLQSFEIINVNVYLQERDIVLEGRATQNFVPVLGHADLENEARDFLIQYCIEALEKPMPVPIADIVREKMHLNMETEYQLTTDLSLFGMIAFKPGKFTVFENINEPLEISVTEPTIFIDPYVTFLRNIGCKNNTIAHEAYHWHRHRLYADIKALLDGEDFIANKCNTEPKSGELKDSITTDEDWMEWQANWVAPRILLPYRTAKMKAEELLSEYKYSPCEKNRFEAMKNVIDDLADFFNVSKQSARIRMIEFGYDDAAFIYNYDEKLPEIRRTISFDDALDEYIKNPDFRETIDTGIFAYVDGSFIINHESLVENIDGEVRLTDYAKENLNRFALQFTDREAFYYYYMPTDHSNGAFYRRNKDAKINRYDQNANSEIVERGEEITRVSDIIDLTYDADTDSNAEFCNRVNTLIEAKGWDYVAFETHTLLNKNIYYEIKHGEYTDPTLESVMQICIGLGTGINTGTQLLSLCGYTLRNTETHSTYKIILTTCAHKDIYFCNRILAKQGLPTLGSE